MALAVSISSSLFGAQLEQTQLESAEPVRQSFQVGKKLYQQLKNPLTVSWDKAELRTIVRQLSGTTGVAIVIDRRLDPHQPITLELEKRPLFEILFEIGRQSGSEVSIQPNYLFLGTPRATRTLRTLILHQREELTKAFAESSTPIPQQLARRQELIWDDLATPLEVIRKINTAYTLKLLNPDQIPHDLLPKCHIPSAVLEQQICTLLIQYDLSYRWVEPGKSYEIVSLPEQVSIAKSHLISASSRDEIEAALLKRPGIEWKWSGENRLELVGRVEDQEWMISLLNPRQREMTIAEGETGGEQKLSLQRFTLKQAGVSVMSVVDELRKSGVDIEFAPPNSEASFRGRKDKVDLDLQNAPPTKLCEQLFNEIPVEFQVLQEKIVLRPIEQP
ncbi:hypothetical protein [Polystyrenella longa]|nr:hypothetical protein [Polystyrenella longa]